MATTKRKLSDSGCGLYVHLPFCKSKCRYCDFNSYAWVGQNLERYVKALLLEARRRVEDLRPQTVFFGGGTPTFLPPDLLSELLEGLNLITGFRNSSIETTMEANPESFTSARAIAIRNGGVNRISVGVQSLRAEVLEAYDRVHSPSQATDALRLGAETFSEVNADLIFAFPGQDPAAWRQDLAEVIRCQPQHLSCYELSYEPGTTLTRLRAAGRWQAEDPDLCQKLFTGTGEQCAQSGYSRYEVSNFCQPGHECQHNLAAWRSLNFIGIGAGAGGSHSGKRRKNLSRPDEYQAAVFAGSDPVADEERPDLPTLLFEHFLMGLRLVDEGVSRTRVQNLTGVDPWQEFGSAFLELAEDGLLHAAEKKDSVQVTQRGLLLLDTILLRILPGASV